MRNKKRNLRFTLRQAEQFTFLSATIFSSQLSPYLFDLTQPASKKLIFSTEEFWSSNEIALQGGMKYACNILLLDYAASKAETQNG